MPSPAARLLAFGATDSGPLALSPMHADPSCPPGRMRLSVCVPPGLVAGRQLRVQHGPRQYDVVIPQGVPPGGTFLMEVEALPASAPVNTPPVPMGLPVHMQRAAPPPPATLTRSNTGRTVVPAAARSQAEMKAECPICFEPLCAAPVGVFLGSDGKRVSQHFYNLAAARAWLSEGTGMCPLTRKRITAVLEVPDIRTDPDGWFRAVDIDGDGRLSRMEVVECLKAQLAVDTSALNDALADPQHWMWQQWDHDNSGYIERNELLQPQGLAAYVRAAFERSAADEAIPDIAVNKEAWYRYWDADGSDSLDKEEVVRALLKTFHMTSDQAAVMQMRQTIDAVWPIFDDDMSGSIERDEFLRGGEGLADTIVATLGLSR